MLKFKKNLLLALACLMVVYASEAFADCKHKEKTCNSSRNHPSKYVGVYYRSDALPGPVIQNLPIITLNESGTAIVYFGEALISYVTTGTLSPQYGNWKYIGNHQVLVLTIGYSAIENSTQNAFHAIRSTMILDFSESLNSPVIIAHSFVRLEGVPPALYLDPNVGTVVTFTNTILPRQLQRICAFASDLNRIN